MNCFNTAFKDKNIMITGGLGFIGSNLARSLLKYDAKITLVDSLIPEYGANLFNIHDIRDRVDINVADMRDRFAMDYLVRDMDYIFNLAGQVSHIDSMTDPETDLEINCKSQLSLLEACKNSNPNVKIIFAGTRQIYGKPLMLPVDEKHPLNPTDVNGINKMAGEFYHILYHRIYDLNTVSLRLTNTYGPGLLMKHNRQGFISSFIRKVIDGEEIQIYGDGNQKRDLNYVDDVVQAFMAAAVKDKANGEVYNLGEKESISLLKLAEKIIEITGSGSFTLIPFPPEKKRIDIGDYCGNYGKIHKELGWEPRVSLDFGLLKTIRYYKKNKGYYW